MADRFDMLASGCARPSAARKAVLALLVLAAARLAPAAPPAAPYVYVPQAHLVGVERAFIGPGSAPAPGAGVRAFRDPEAENSGTERFEIRWYANPPGIPPGTVLLLESVQERSPLVKNHVLRTTGKSEGNVRSTIEIPSADVRRGGRVVQWRVRVVWRGNALATQASPNWKG